MNKFQLRTNSDKYIIKSEANLPELSELIVKDDLKFGLFKLDSDKEILISIKDIISVREL